MSEQPGLANSLEVFAKFGECFATGLTPRFDGEITTPAPEVERTSTAFIAASIPDGALFARTLWGDEGDERTGCFLWTGEVTALLGDDEAKAVAALSDEEVDTLDGSLKLGVEEGGEEGEKLPVDWSGLERVTAEEIPGRLAEIGVAEEGEGVRLEIDLAGKKMVFLFLASNQGAAPAEVPAEAPEEHEPLAEGQYSGTSHTEEDTVAMAAAAAAAAAVSAGPPDGTGAAALGEPASDLAPEQLLNLEHLLDVRLPLTIRLGSTRMNLEELLKLMPGAILELDRREDEPLEVIANGQIVARGEVVVVDERFGLRITELGAAEERAPTAP